jgi:phosphate/sulfate permease
MSPTRGWAIELGAATTVLMASRLALPVSTTQCLTGSALGVALMNYDLKAVNWRQIAFIFSSWVLTLPVAGLIVSSIPLYHVMSLDGDEALLIAKIWSFDGDLIICRMLLLTSL